MSVVIFIVIKLWLETNNVLIHDSYDWGSFDNDGDDYDDADVDLPINQAFKERITRSGGWIVIQRIKCTQTNIFFYPLVSDLSTG